MTIQDLKDKNLIIFEGIVGSQAYGIATPTSDIDIKGVYIQPIEDILSFGYVEQVSDDTNDTTYYEIKRFLQLVSTNNPTILELLNLPEDCIKIKESIFNLVLQHKDDLITKNCKNSFGGYAIEQIKKARGLNKKIVNPVDKEKKTILDFCYIIDGYNTIPIKDFFEKNYIKQENCGLINLPHAKDLYSVFYSFCIPYKGITNLDDTSNEVRLSSIPKDEKPIATMIYNKDGYSTYCKKYKEYWDWVKKRNPQRYLDNMLHDGGYDGKNLAHCHRLLDMAIEIGEGKGILVRRKNRDKLLSIRRGEYNYDDLILEAEEKITKMDEIFEKSNLPKEVDKKLINDLLLTIRKKWYGL
jgi:uncharacterized protein